MSSEWKQSLCNCFGDCEICLCGSFCGLCLNYKNAENLGKSGILYTLLACIMPCVPLLLLRQEARERYNIEVSQGSGDVRGLTVIFYFCLQGSTCDDVVATVCCGTCVLCQVRLQGS